MSRFSTIPRQGIGNLAAPGLAIPSLPRFIAPDSSNRDAIELMQVLGMVGGAVQAAGQYQQEKRADEKRAELALRGAAAKDADTISATMVGMVNAGTYHAPAGLRFEQFPSFATELVDSYVGVDPEVSEVTREEIRARVVPDVTAALFRQHERTLQQEQPYFLDLQINRLFGVSDSAEFTKSENELVANVRFNRAAAKQALGLGAMELAIARAAEDPSGAVATFEVAERYLGDFAPINQAVMRGRLHSALEGKAGDDVYRMLNEGEPFEVIRQRIREFSGIVPDKARPAFESVDDEKAFQTWYAEFAAQNGLAVDPDAPEHHYDYRRAFEAGAKPGPDGHWPSGFKLADHPNRFIDGIDTARPRGAVIDQQSAHALLKVVDAAEDEHRTETLRALVVEQADRFKAVSFDHAERMMASANVTGGAAMIEDAAFVDAGGREHKISRNLLIEAATERAFDRITEAYKAEPQKVVARQIEFLARNNVTYKPWQRTMEAGYTVLVTDLDKVRKDGKAALPKNAADGFGLYRELSARDGRLAMSHVTDERVRDFYETASVALEFLTPGDPQAAMVLAVRSMDRVGGTGVSASIRDDVRKRVGKQQDFSWWPWSLGGGWDFSQVQNRGVIENKVERRASLLVSAYGINVDDAVKRAAQRTADEFAIINGWAVDTSKAAVPASGNAADRSGFMTDAVRQVGEEYINKHREENEPVKLDDLTFMPIEDGSGWVLINKRTLVPVENAEFRIFSNMDLARLRQATVTAAREAAIAQAVRESRTAVGTPPLGMIIPALAPLRTNVPANLRSLQTGSIRELLEHVPEGN